MTETPRYLISACLCGEICRYDGADYSIERFVRLVESGLAIPVCPEVLGGLPTPRSPCEILNGRVFTKDGEDVTEAFLRGARLTLELAEKHAIRLVIMKERSPSCGSGIIYDGSFSGRRIPGAGIAAAVLRHHGIQVINEEEASQYL